MIPDSIRIPFEQAAQGDWEQLSYVAATVGTLPIVTSGVLALYQVTSYFRNKSKHEEEARTALAEQQRLAREEVARRIKAEKDAFILQLEEIDGDLRGQYFSVIDDFLKYPALHQHHKPIDPAQSESQKLVYTKLIILFATAFRRLYGRDNEDMKEQWLEWEDEIDDWSARPNFRNALDELLVGEKQAFTEYMQKKKIDVPESVDPRPQKAKTGKKGASAEVVPSP